jgi:hypothetical protein
MLQLAGWLEFGLQERSFEFQAYNGCLARDFFIVKVTVYEDSNSWVAVYEDPYSWVTVSENPNSRQLFE